MNIPDHDNMMKWVKMIREHWNAVSWWKRLMLVIIIILVGGVIWWYIRLNSSTDLKTQYTAGRDMSVYNIGNVQQFVIGAQPDDIENLHRLATAYIFKVMDDQLKNEIHNNLVKVQQKFIPSLPRIIISGDKGNQNRLKVADEIGKLLSDSGFNVAVRSSNIYSQERKPIKVIFNPKHLEFVKAMLMAFEPALRATISLQKVQNRQSEEIAILILGEPRFSDTGIIVFE